MKKKDGRSIGANNVPDDPELLGIVKEKNGKIYYYKDKRGEYFYQSEMILNFDREMKEAQRRRKERRRAERIS